MRFIESRYKRYTHLAEVKLSFMAKSKKSTIKIAMVFWFGVAVERHILTKVLCDTAALVKCDSCLECLDQDNF